MIRWEIQRFNPKTKEWEPIGKVRHDVYDEKSVLAEAKKIPEIYEKMIGFPVCAEVVEWTEAGIPANIHEARKRALGWTSRAKKGLATLKETG